MKKFLLAIMMCLATTLSTHAQMSDKQIIQFIAREQKAGTSQSQIVVKLMQRGVKIEQIRRLRNQYDKQITKRGLAAAADGAVTEATERMKANTDGTTSQELTTAKRGTTGEVYADAAEEHEEAERDVEATQRVRADAAGKRVFGRNIFRQANPNFAPNENMPIPDTYVLGPGDQVVVDIYGASQNASMYTIAPDGTIRVSGYGPIYLSGLSVTAAQTKLRQTMGSRYQSSSLKMTVGNTRTIQVNIMGEVRAPGTYHLSAFANVLYALYRAGGTSQLGTLRNIKVYRNGRLVTVVDLYQFILNGRLAGNIMLQDNDVIQVGTYDCLVGITGNVKRPMFYEMRKDESLGTLIRYAGGFTSDAHKKSVRLVRQAGERYTVHNVDEFEMNNFKVADGDAVTVEAILNRYDNMVEVKGAVFRPGQFNLNGNTNSVRSLIQAAEGLTEDAFTQHAIIHRLKADRTLEIIPVDVQGILNGTAADVALQNEDVLFIPTQEELRKERYFTITGEVMSPGQYEFADNTTIEDLIVQAGGLRDGANLSRVDVSRRINDPYSKAKTREIAKTFTFELKDGLVIDKDKSFVLQPYDVVHVRRSPSYVMPRNITITGEVNYEGAFTLENKNMRLSDAIKMAGGITDVAYLKGARLVRQLNDEERVRQRATLNALREILTEKRDSISVGDLELGSSYTVGIDLTKALESPGSDVDIILREGDRIYVPEYNPIVKISGDVMFPNTVFFEKGKSYKKYVAQAGGFGNRANKSKSFIVYQNGTVGLVKQGAKPEPGCEIIVPSKKRRNPFNVSTLISAGVSLASIGAVIAALTK